MLCSGYRRRYTWRSFAGNYVGRRYGAGREDDVIEKAPSLQEALTSLRILRKYLLSGNELASELESMVHGEQTL